MADTRRCTIGNPETLAVVADLLRVPKQSLERALLFRKFAAAAPSRRAMSPSLQVLYYHHNHTASPGASPKQV
jgi:hypothetical protein